MRPIARSLGIAAAALAALLATPAPAQQTMRWQGREGEGKTFLAYEVPESGEQSLLLVCDTRARRFSLHYQDDRDRVRDGTQAVVEFASEEGRVAVPMRAARQEMGDAMLLGAETPLTPALGRVLSGGTLRVTLSGVTERIPLAEARRGVAALIAACGER